MKKIKPAIAVAAWIGVTAAALFSAIPAQADTVRPLDVLTSAANAYASEHLMQIYEKADITGVIVIKHGAGYGQTLHPSIDQLKTLGYLPPNFAGGDVSLEFSPAGCLNAKAGDCSILVRAAAQGRENHYSIPVRAVPDRNDNPSQ
jgi:hypothetical protein